MHTSSLDNHEPPFWGNGTATSPYGRGGLHTENIQVVARVAQETGRSIHFDANGTVLRIAPGGDVELVLPGDADKQIDELRTAVQQVMQLQQ